MQVENIFSDKLRSESKQYYCRLFLKSDASKNVQHWFSVISEMVTLMLYYNYYKSHKPPTGLRCAWTMLVSKSPICEKRTKLLDSKTADKFRNKKKKKTDQLYQNYKYAYNSWYQLRLRTLQSLRLFFTKSQLYFGFFNYFKKRLTRRPPRFFTMLPKCARKSTIVNLNKFLKSSL